MISDSKRREVSRKLGMLDVDGIEHGYELLEEVADCTTLNETGRPSRSASC